MAFLGSRRGPAVGGKTEDLGRGTWLGLLETDCGRRPHCCLQADSRRILLPAEQALRAGLEAALARRSALDLVPSGADSVPLAHSTLGRPRLCPFCPDSSSGTCPGTVKS